MADHRDVQIVLDEERIDDAVLALLLLGLHDHDRAWKGFPWAALDRLHKRDLISNPRSKAKSVAFSEEGLRRSQALLKALFAKSN
jgi:hypothetical protein